MDEQFVSIGKAAKMIGMSIEGLRKWEHEGRLVPLRTLTNQRRYRVADLRALMQEMPEGGRESRCILYARVSTKKQQEAGHLERQLGRLTTFAAQHHWTTAGALTDVASGLNEKRRGLHEVLVLAQEKKASLVVVESQDRLTRFGFHYLESYLHAFGVQIVVMDPETPEDQPELAEDLIAITAEFSARIDGTRGGKELITAMHDALTAKLGDEGDGV
jgi:predicted site-specific integrase-resolvase